MALGLAEVGADKFATAESILGWSVWEMSQADPLTLAQTQYTQPCIYTVSAILTDRLRLQGHQPHLVAGHSLGEYSALYAVGVLTFAEGLRLVKERSLLMAQTTGGKMTALIGFDRHKLNDLVAAQPEVVIANDNSPDQVVISGTATAVDNIVQQLGAKRAVPLPVSGAFHSPLMAEAEAKLAEIIASTNFCDPQCPVLLNSDPTTPLTDGASIKQRLLTQITAPVRWREIGLYLQNAGFDEVWEVGPGRVLTGLLKRTAPQLKLRNVDSLANC
jgi:[acyl-carrier-protein] S-malonyltransferase